VFFRLPAGLTLPGPKVTKDQAPVCSATCSRLTAKLKELASLRQLLILRRLRAAGARLATDGAGKAGVFNLFSAC